MLSCDALSCRLCWRYVRNRARVRERVTMKVIAEIILMAFLMLQCGAIHHMCPLASLVQ